MRLAGKVCIVTGAASGIGLASAQLFAAEGATVISADLEGTPYRVDVADEEETRALAAAVVTEHGRIDVLFNNAGIAGVGDVEETSLELWEQVMRVNVRGVFLMSRAVVPTMIAQRSGSIVNMSSAIAETGLARRVSYAASKGAVLALTKSMQVDLAPHGVRVNALLPGTIMTPFVERYLKESRTPTRRKAGARSVRASSAESSVRRRTPRTPRSTSRPTSPASCSARDSSWTAGSAPARRNYIFVYVRIATPVSVVTVSARRSSVVDASPWNNFLPEPTRTGCTISRYSSMRPCRVSSSTTSPLP